MGKKNEGIFFFNAKAEKCQIACRTRNSESKGSFPHDTQNMIISDKNGNLNNQCVFELRI